MRNLHIAIFVCGFFILLLPGLPAQTAEGGQRSLTFADAASLALAASADLRNAYASQRLSERAWVWGMRTYLPRLSLSASENDRLQHKPGRIRS